MNRQLNHGEHEDITILLPWYVNGTLDEADRQRVDAHLATCEVCRDELSLCNDMRDATVTDGTIPIPPLASAAGVLARADRRGGYLIPRKRRALGIAAALVAVSLTFVFAVQQYWPTEAPNQRFTATTSEIAADSVDYVLELRFGNDVRRETRSRILEELGSALQSESQSNATYTIMMRLPPQSLSELERRAAELALREEIDAAEFVALQVPVR